MLQDLCLPQAAAAVDLSLCTRAGPVVWTGWFAFPCCGPAMCVCPAWAANHAWCRQRPHLAEVEQTLGESPQGWAWTS
eukprot:4112433-Amphidinium_carterae.1